MAKATYLYNEKEFFKKLLNNNTDMMQELFNGSKFYNLKIDIEEHQCGGYGISIFNDNIKINKSDLPNNLKSIINSCFNNFIINSSVPDGVQIYQ